MHVDANNVSKVIFPICVLMLYNILGGRKCDLDITGSQKKLDSSKCLVE